MLVAQELNRFSISEELFAAPPHIETREMLFSMAVIAGKGYRRGQQDQVMNLDFIDVLRAHFDAMPRMRAFIKLHAIILG